MGNAGTFVKLNSTVPEVYVKRLQYYMANKKCAGDTTNDGEEINMFGGKGEGYSVAWICSFEGRNNISDLLDGEGKAVFTVLAPWLSEEMSEVKVAIANINGGPILHQEYPVQNSNDIIDNPEIQESILDSGGCDIIEIPIDDIDYENHTLTLHIPIYDNIHNMYWFRDYKMGVDGSDVNIEYLTDPISIVLLVFLVNDPDAE